MTETRHDEMREQVIAFHNAHPRVWELFVKFAFEKINKGFQHYSVNGIFERIRWETDQAEVDPSKHFKIGNNHRPFYSRRFMQMYPEYKGFFRTRIQKSREKPATGLPEITPSDLAYEEQPHLQN